MAIFIRFRMYYFHLITVDLNVYACLDFLILELFMWNLRIINFDDNSAINNFREVLKFTNFCRLHKIRDNWDLANITRSTVL